MPTCRAITRWFALRAVLAPAAAGAAYAAVPSADGTITGCVAPSGKLQVIDAEGGETCKRREQTLTWNQQGVAGPRGPVGPQGPPGASAAPLAYAEMVEPSSDCVDAPDPTLRLTTPVFHVDEPTFVSLDFLASPVPVELRHIGPTPVVMGGVGAETFGERGALLQAGDHQFELRHTCSSIYGSYDNLSMYLRVDRADQ